MSRQGREGKMRGDYWECGLRRARLSLVQFLPRQVSYITRANRNWDPPIPPATSKYHSHAQSHVNLAVDDKIFDAKYRRRRYENVAITERRNEQPEKGREARVLMYFVLRESPAAHRVLSASNCSRVLPLAASRFSYFRW